MNNGNTSSSGTLTTAGFRGVSVITSSTINTDNTSAKTLTGTGDAYQMGNSVSGEGSGTSQYESSGIIKYSRGSKIGTSDQSGNSIKISIDATHRHQLTANGYLYGKTDDESQNHTHSVTASGTISGDTETRPINYTIRVWKRVS